MEVNNAEFDNMRENPYLTENKIEKEKIKEYRFSAYIDITGVVGEHSAPSVNSL